MCSCQTPVKNDKQVMVISKEIKEKLLKFQKKTEFKSDSLGNVKLYICYFSESKTNQPMSMPYHLCNLKVNKNTFSIRICSYSPVKPLYTTDINLTINKNYSYTIFNECRTDVLNDVLKFDSLQRNCKTGTLYISDSLRPGLDKLTGYITIDYYKDKTVTKKDFSALLFFNCFN